MGEGVSLGSEFGSKGYLNCYDGMIGLSGIRLDIAGPKQGGALGDAGHL